MPSRTYKFRGQRTHGRGFKSGRGAGIRGGRGNAGLHKHKMKSMVKYAPMHFGRHGFKRPPEIVEEVREINIETIREKLETWLKEGYIAIENGNVNIDLTSMGYDKLLSKGFPSGSWNITVKSATQRSIEKIEKVKGKVNLKEGVKHA